VGGEPQFLAGHAPDQKGEAMTLIRVAPLVILTALAAPGASAQMFTGPTGQMAAPPPQQGMPPCMAEFVPLRQEAEKRAGAVKAGAERKASREEICALFKSFSDAEVKVIKYLTTNATACGIPPQAIAETKASHGRTTTTMQKICSAQAVGEGRPRGSGLSEALGVRAVPTPETTKSGKGIFDTLSGTQPEQ
jgi:hypothetical protein